MLEDKVQLQIHAHDPTGKPQSSDCSRNNSEGLRVMGDSSLRKELEEEVMEES